MRFQSVWCCQTTCIRNWTVDKSSSYIVVLFFLFGSLLSTVVTYRAKIEVILCMQAAA